MKRLLWRWLLRARQHKRVTRTAVLKIHHELIHRVFLHRCPGCLSLLHGLAVPVEDGLALPVHATCPSARAPQLVSCKSWASRNRCGKDTPKHSRDCAIPVSTKTEDIECHLLPPPASWLPVVFLVCPSCCSESEDSVINLRIQHSNCLWPLFDFLNPCTLSPSQVSMRYNLSSNSLYLHTLPMSKLHQQDRFFFVGSWPRHSCL